MNRRFLNVFLYVILAYTVISIVAREAIIGGELASITPFRFMVSLLEVDYGHLCGGALVGDKFVLSAAHCFMWSDNTFKGKRIFALMGTNDLMKMNLPAVNSEVIKIYVPKEFRAHDINATADIAVLRLKDTLILAYSHMKVAYLGKNRINVYSGEKATVLGWGWNHIELKNHQFTGYRTDSLLRHAMADVFSHQQCQQEHPTLKITEDHLCAKIIQREHEERSVCHGDDGGPLIHKGFVIGVLSKFADSCAERNDAAIYTRVSHYLTFIRKSKEDNVTKNMRAHEIFE